MRVYDMVRIKSELRYDESQDEMGFSPKFGRVSFLYSVFDALEELQDAFEPSERGMR